ncbi:MAG: hypothetical protein JKY30_04995 [Flavobacteriales bacterium]|nr:hypothetical protein [Flavobacteriales bacterium]
MSFGGSALAMIQSLKANKLLLGKRYTYFDAKKEYLIAAKGLKISNQKATPEQIRNIKELIRKQKRVAGIRLTIALSIIFPLIIFGAYKFSGLFKNEMTHQQIVVKEKSIEKYKFHINDGDAMLNKGKWNNAIFQYTQASEILPNEYDAQYRLALAYTYKCKYTNNACGKSDSLVNRLLEHFPDNEKVQGLRVSLDNQL